MIGYFIYLILKGFSLLINLPPENFALWVGRQMGKAAYYLDWEHRLVVKKPVELVLTGDMEKDVEINMQRFTRVLESMIREYPDQWIWIHRRWERKKDDKCSSRQRLMKLCLRKGGKRDILAPGEK